MGLVIPLQVALGYGGVGLVAELQGTSVASMEAWQQALTVDCTEVLTLLGTIAALRDATSASPVPYPTWGVYHWSAAAGLCGVLGACLAVGVVAAAQNLLGQHEARDADQLAAILGGGGLPAAAGLLAASTVLAPVVEEMVYRGFLLRGLRVEMPAAAAVALSSALFAAMHLDGPSLLPLTALGAALGVTYLASGGSLLACSLAHGLYNAAALLSLF